MTQFPHDVAVCAGRFQPFHHGHLALLRHALSLARHCVVVLGAAHQARTPRNPFTWRERAEMIRLALAAPEQERLHFVPVRDFYDLHRWQQAVESAVAHRCEELGLGNGAQVVRVGALEDDGPDGPHVLSNSAWSGLPKRPGIDGTALRNALFQGAEQPEAALAALGEHLPDSTRGFLRAWTALPYYEALAQEWRMLKRYREEWASAPYPPVFVTVDTVVHCAGRVLLVQRGHAPGKGLLALPGGFIEPHETAWQSARRELREETRLDVSDKDLQQALKDRHVFDHPWRSERGRTITHAHHVDLGDRTLPAVEGGDDAAAAMWVEVAELRSLEDRFLDDHFHILDHFLGLLVEDVSASDA